MRLSAVGQAVHGNRKDHTPGPSIVDVHNKHVVETQLNEGAFVVVVVVSEVSFARTTRGSLVVTGLGKAL